MRSPPCGPMLHVFAKTPTWARHRAAVARDPIERMKARSRVTEYVREAQKRDARAVELRAQLPRRRP
jgi:hypothetical protein